jgi:hypothetical protein
VIYSVGLLLLGSQLMSIGFIAELIIANHRHDAKTYSISARTGSTEEDLKSSSSP